MLSTDVVNIIAPCEHQRTLMDLARDWRRAQAPSETSIDDVPTLDSCEDGERVIIVGFPAAALPVLTRGNIPFQLQR